MNNKLVIYSLLAMLLIFSAQGCGVIQSLGQNPEGASLDKIEKLQNYKEGKFQNLDGDDSVEINGFKALKSLLNRSETVSPFNRLPSMQTDLQNLKVTAPTVVWFGHSSVLIRTKTGNILIDPIFSKSAGPIPGMVKAFKGSTGYSSDDMPVIDVLLISHDHYDHLDYKTVKKLKDRIKKVVVPIGVGSHFIHWGFDPEKITELNWNESIVIAKDIQITATPARHRSNRTLATDKTLWASYVINTDGHKVFYSGDGGYGAHFKEIGQQYGPFDLALMECGQYSPNWPTHHMNPEQTAQAAADLQANTVQPVHWAKFAESHHPWNEPVNRLLTAAKIFKYKVSIPEIGQPYILGEPAKTKIWWNYEQE
jgi:L-ascorbate metabolism protein UlaG (beta-lactamase superfamily)